MTAKQKSKSEVSYANGWLHGQEVTEDDTDGERKLVAGLSTRVRLSMIYSYQVVEPGILAIFVVGVKENLFMIGSLKEMDKIMGRTNLKEVDKC